MNELERLKEAFSNKMDDYDNMSAEDAKFKDTTTAMCNLAETISKQENQEKDQELKQQELKVKKIDLWTKIGLTAAGTIVVPIVLNTLNHIFKRDIGREFWMNEKDGVVMSPTSKMFMNDCLRDDKY